MMAQAAVDNGCLSTLRGEDHSTPRTQAFYRKTQMCKFYQSHKCTKGSDCDYAHGVAELQVAPNFTRTRMCPQQRKVGVCRRQDCSYAHREEELRPTVRMNASKPKQEDKGCANCCLSKRSISGTGTDQIGAVQSSACRQTPTLGPCADSAIGNIPGLLGYGCTGFALAWDTTLQVRPWTGVPHVSSFSPRFHTGGRLQELETNDDEPMHVEASRSPPGLWTVSALERSQPMFILPDTDRHTGFIVKGVGFVKPASTYGATSDTASTRASSAERSVY